MFELDYGGDVLSDVMSSAFRSEEEILDAVSDLGSCATRADIQGVLDDYGYDYRSLPTYLQEMVDAVDAEER